MDLKGSLTDTHLKILPSERLLNYIQNIPVQENVPENFMKFKKNKCSLNPGKTTANNKIVSVDLSDKDFESLKKVREIVGKIESTKSIETDSEPGSDNSDKDSKENDASEESLKPSSLKLNTEGKCVKDAEEIPKKINNNEAKKSLNETQDSTGEQKDNEKVPNKEQPYLLTSDLKWLYTYLIDQRSNGEKDVPYLHELLEGSDVTMPENKVLKRNPALEARCVKLRAQQEAREYRKMTKGVDNVRMRFPEDSIAYQLKQVNRQLIAIGQFIISIFAGFLFGFKGVEWMVGPLDMGFRLLLGVIVALIIALAEIYFIAKKLNEELNVPETVQLGGPPKFSDESMNNYASRTKEHQD